MFGNKFVDLVSFLVEGRQHINKGPNLIRIKNDAISLVFLIQVNELKHIRFPTFKYKALRKHLILAHIRNFYLKDKLVVSQGYVFGDVEWQICLKLVFLSLVPRDLSFDEIDLGILRRKLIRIDVFIVAEEFIELLREVFRCIIHIDLHLILIFMVNSEGENEAQLLLGSKLGDHLLGENLFLGLWRCSTRSLVWRRLYISDVEYFEFDFFEAVACGVVLDGEQDFEMFTHANLSKRWIEVYGIRSGDTIEGYV